MPAVNKQRARRWVGAGIASFARGCPSPSLAHAHCVPQSSMQPRPTRPLVGSSRKTRLGPATTPHAMARRRRSPPLRPRSIRPPGRVPPTCAHAWEGACRHAPEHKDTPPEISQPPRRRCEGVQSLAPQVSTPQGRWKRPLHALVSRPPLLPRTSVLRCAVRPISPSTRPQRAILRLAGTPGGSTTEAKKQTVSSAVIVGTKLSCCRGWRRGVRTRGA
jgi:hypothetical protein